MSNGCLSRLKALCSKHIWLLTRLLSNVFLPLLSILMLVCFLMSNFCFVLFFHSRRKFPLTVSLVLGYDLGTIQSCLKGTQAQSSGALFTSMPASFLEGRVSFIPQKNEWYFSQLLSLLWWQDTSLLQRNTYPSFPDWNQLCFSHSLCMKNEPSCSWVNDLCYS